MQITFDIIQSLSIIIASFVAIYGITSWRRETTWKRKYELTEEVLSLFYECKEKFQIIRSPAGHSLEGKTRKRGENETPDESERLDNAYVFIERYEKEKEPFLKLWPLKFRFMTIFDKEAGQPFDEIRRILNTIFLAASRLGQRYWKDQGSKHFTDLEFQKHLKEMHENEEIIWGSFDETDKISIQIDNCIAQIEKYCEGIMKK
ncbi:MAG: hypothetical protein HYZ42_15995 [Bacteroidetes bacterium]|nr:hypothetical protein [Bacteroidota bacterium]